MAWASALLAAVVTAIWASPRAGPENLPTPNAIPVIVLIDSPLPGRVYDPRTFAEGGTNADDVTDALRALRLAIRSVFETYGGEEQWVATQVARLPMLKDRLNAFSVPGGREKASFREPQTAQLLRARVARVLDLEPQ